MNGRDQAAGLRQWANLRAEQRGADEILPEDAPPTAAGAPEPQATIPRVTIPLVVVGLPTRNITPVKERLAEWSALGRHWAATPESWEIMPVDAETPLEALRTRYSRWALWVRSDADAFSAMYRTLRQVSENQGPRQLLALHEPHLPRQGLLDNLQKAAAGYLNLELLLLAR
ncbi:hypothetical protein [Vreelandella sp. EE22]